MRACVCVYVCVRASVFVGVNMCVCVCMRCVHACLSLDERGVQCGYQYQFMFINQQLMAMSLIAYVMFSVSAFAVHDVCSK